MNSFFDMKSCRSRGTLSQLKAEFDRKNVSTSVSDCFNHVSDFIEVQIYPGSILIVLYL